MNFWITLVVTLALELYVLRRLRFDRVVVALVLASTLLAANTLTYTSIEERNYDGTSQLVYIESLRQHWRLPNVHDCGICGHPPLYYAVAALWSKIVQWGGWMPVEQGLQWLSILMFFGFAVFSVCILRSCIRRPWTLRFATALVLFWPSSVLNAVRVHNDSLSSLLMVAALYFIAEWDRRERARDFYASLAFVALALLTKASGYTMAATLLCVTLVKIATSPYRRQWLGKCATALVVVATAGVLATSFRESRWTLTDCQVVFGLACDSRYVPTVIDTPGRYLYFDPVDFVCRLKTFPDDPQRDYFLNRLAKSSLFGVAPLGDDFASPRYSTLARITSGLFLVLVAVGGLALAFQRGIDWRKYRTYVLSLAIMFTFLVAFRLRAPNEFHEDFRHIFPALVPLCLGYAKLVERLSGRSKYLGMTAAAVGAAMIASSLALFVRLG